MKLVLGTFDDVPSARACKDELGRRGYNRVHLIESVNTLTTHGLPREAIQRHRADLERGGCLLVVRCEPAQEPEVRRILEAGYAAGLGGRDTMAQQGTIRVPLAEEEVSVGKAVQQKGGVRLHTYTEEQPVETTVNLKEEHVEVSRHPVDRPATAADQGLFTDRTIQVDETVEVPVVEKQARIVEEVEVRKDVDVKPTTVRETVRRQQVDVDENMRAHVDDPATRFGYELADDATYRDRDWSLIENDARTRWGRSNDISTWDKMKASIRNAFESRRAERRRPIP
jgi:stress response protein YsnF